MADLDLPPIFEERLVCRVINQRVEECVLSFDVGEQRLSLIINKGHFYVPDQPRQQNNRGRFLIYRV